MAEAIAKSGFTGKEAAHPARPAFTLFARPTAKTGLVSWLTTVDHKKIGMLYGGFAICFFLIGGLEALDDPHPAHRARTTISSAPISTTSCSRCTAPR